VQGFLVARPLSASAIPTFVETSRQHLLDLQRAIPAVEEDVSSTGTVRALRTAASFTRR
jgi:hypothetical protein